MPDLEEILMEPPRPGTMLDFRAMFGDDAPVEMEIGVGKGGFLLNRARALPDRRFFGVEWANKIYLYAADRVRRWGLTNIRLMRTDARHLVLHHLPAESLTMLHIYHPDPWPKKRHHKRRLIQPAFIEAAARALVPGGRVAIQTDHATYFEQIQEVLRAASELREVPFDVPETGVGEGQIGSNYEIKYRREGRDIFQISAIRVPSEVISPEPT